MNAPSDHMTRRGFFKTTGTLGVGALAGGMGSAALPGEAAAGKARSVPRRPFGKTGTDVAILSLGGMFDIPTNQLLLKQAVRWGVTYWDTANSYMGGRSEEGFGDYFASYPADRDKIFLVTKSTARSPGGLSRHLDLSLKRMKTSHVDLFFVHAIRSIDTMDDDLRAWGEKAKAAGKLRLFGFSTHSNMESCLAGAARLGWIDGIMFTYNHRLMHTDRMRRAVDACHAAGIGLTAMKTQGGGQLKTDSPAEMELADRLLEKGYTDGQVRLKAVWENPQIASICSQMPSLNLLMTNTAAAMDRTRLSSADRRLMRQLAEQTRHGYCAGCAVRCETALETAVPVADVMRCLMYARSYGDADRARARLRRIEPEVRQRMAAMDYRRAEARCPQGMPIGRLVREALTELA